MWNDGLFILWQHITHLFYQDMENGLKLSPRLTFEHINITSFSAMRVNLAAQVLSSSVAAVIKTYSPPDTAATAKLCEMMDSFFDFLNVCSTFEHQRKRTISGTIHLPARCQIQVAAKHSKQAWGLHTECLE